MDELFDKICRKIQARVGVDFVTVAALDGASDPKECTLSCLPKPSSFYHEVKFDRKGITISGQSSSVSFPYESIASIRTLDYPVLPKVCLWGAKYYMMDTAEIELHGGAIVETLIAASPAGLRQVVIWEFLWRLIQRHRAAAASAEAENTDNV